MENKFQIRALYNEDTIRVYQAYNSIIAGEAVKNNTFGPSFNRDRMTWIKPSFLWMMYRSGWATKENQERILAIDIKREAFDYIVKNAVESKYSDKNYSSMSEWKKALKRSNVRVQWDPERDVYGNPLNYRSIQLGIRGECVKKFVDEWIVSITDISSDVYRLKALLDDGKEILELLPKESIYE